MRKHRPLTPEIKARRVAARIRSQRHLDALLRQFTPAHHAGIIERLKPHLPFEPRPFEHDPVKPA
ncbi:MAG: hypothetical protein ABSF62_02360 [Bryobacteraceae bacterium]